MAAVCQASYLPPAFGRIVRQGRHRCLGLLWATQRLNEVSHADKPHGRLGGLLNGGAERSASLGEYAEKIAELLRFRWLGFDVDDRETFKDAERLRALWGAPKAWKVKQPEGHRGNAVTAYPHVAPIVEWHS